MKLIIDGEVSDVNFWSFLKCNVYTSLVITTIVFLASILVSLFILI